MPAPENVALAGEPNTAGCGVGAARQESAVVHAGAAATEPGHGDCALQTRASYTSNEVSKSRATSGWAVKKNTSSPVSLASRNPYTPEDVPEEIRSTQPPDVFPNVAETTEQSPMPTGSYS